MSSKTYLVRRDTIKEALDHIEEFTAKMDLFVSKHPDYTYTISICEVPSKNKFPGWEVRTNIVRNEKLQENKSGTSIA